MQLDHANIVVPDLDKTVGFLTEVLGLKKGHRPGFRLPGAWLYSQGQPLIHLSQGSGESPAGTVSPRIDHIALRVADLDEWNALLDRLEAHGIQYRIHTPNDGSDFQLWVSPAAGITVEMIVTPL